MGGCVYAEQVASSYFNGYDRLLDVFHEIGSSLPQFHDIAEINRGSDQMANYLCLFYADIIEFHYQAMRFFRQTSITLCVHRLLTVLIGLAQDGRCSSNACGRNARIFSK